MSMFKIESYVTPILLSYVDKYVKDFKPADAQVSLWGGGVVLHNLVLKADVLQQEVSLPFTLVSGRIHELLIQVPWTKIMSEPIIVTIDTIECVLNLKPPNPPAEDEEPTRENSNRQVVEAPPGYMQALVRRVVSNVVLRLDHLIVKYVEDDIVLSLNVKHLQINCADGKWQPAFVDIDPALPVMRRLIEVEDLTLCLDQTDADGKIRFFQEPLLYRCQLSFRVLTRLQSAATRRTAGLAVHVHSSRLAWSVTRPQLALLLRVARTERVGARAEPAVSQVPSPAPTSSEREAATQSWSTWAWSRLEWSEREDQLDQAPPAAVPHRLTVTLDHVAVVFKVMETDASTGKKRARPLLELEARRVALLARQRAPLGCSLRAAVRSLALAPAAGSGSQTVYLEKADAAAEDTFQWPPEMYDMTIEPQEEEEVLKAVESVIREESAIPTPTPGTPEPRAAPRPPSPWDLMDPVVQFTYTHDRTPPVDAPLDAAVEMPTDFEYSDWAEAVATRVVVAPLRLQVCSGLLQRLAAVAAVLDELPAKPAAEPPKRTLTIEEIEALNENLPQRRTDIHLRGVSVRVLPWDAAEAPLALECRLPAARVVITGPLYPHRVCAAACQIPDEEGPLWRAARLRLSASVTDARALLAPPTGQPRPVARASFTVQYHRLLNEEYFADRSVVEKSYSVKIKELNISGSLSRMTAACQVPLSLLRRRASTLLQVTTLPTLAVQDEESVAVDVTAEELEVQAHVTRRTRTVTAHLQSLKATAFHKEPRSEELRQAWLFSGPDTQAGVPYVRFAMQWSENMADTLDYFGIWTEPTAVSLDPLLLGWLSDRPTLRTATEWQPQLSTKTISSVQYFQRRRTTPPSSSGRVSTAAELVHAARPRSRSSSSQKDYRPSSTATQGSKPEPSLDGAVLIDLHSTLRRALVRVSIGLVLVYVPNDTVSAVDCAAIRDAQERHALISPILVCCLGRISLRCNGHIRSLWSQIRKDGPTYLKVQNMKEYDAFPWTIELADMSCYTLEPSRETDSKNEKKPKVVRKTILELVTTSVTLSVVSKALQGRPPGPKEAHKASKKKAAASAFEERIKYFTSGGEFKPTSLKEFVRGPLTRKKPEPQKKPVAEAAEAAAGGSGPVVSIGVNLHADTPPVQLRLDNQQVIVVGAAMHCVSHVVSLVRQLMTRPGKRPAPPPARAGLTRSVEREEHTPSDDRTPSESELIEIFESPSVMEESLYQAHIKPSTFLWCQWVVSRATLVVSTATVKLSTVIEDVIATVDVQSHYNQVKLKFASASIKHYERADPGAEWRAGALGGRVLEAREPAAPTDDTHFLCVTVTQAQISTLPDSWKEELHPKLLQSKNSVDVMWEIYMTVAPLEAVLQPRLARHAAVICRELMPRSRCRPQEPAQTSARPSQFQWPYLYVTAGGLRLLVHADGEGEGDGLEEEEGRDDTFVFSIGKIEINPHPENPICRRWAGAADNEGAWNSAGAMEGRQYEVYVKHASIHSASRRQLVQQEEYQARLLKGAGSENPAVKWNQPAAAPITTPILHNIELSLILAPALYTGESLACGAAVELNLTSDCSLDVGLHQVALCRDLAVAFAAATSKIEIPPKESELSVCRYEKMVSSLLRSPHVEEAQDAAKTAGNTEATDSGVDTAASSRRGDFALRKSASFTADELDPADYLEVFVTMGAVDAAVYAFDDGASHVLRPPEPEPRAEPRAAEVPHVPKPGGTIPLFHVTLQQPNMYYWKKKTQKTLQLSLFNMAVALGSRSWKLELISTARGAADPETDIPPAVATLTASPGSTAISRASNPLASRGTMRLDIERPVTLHVSEDRLRRLRAIGQVISKNLCESEVSYSLVQDVESDEPWAYRIRNFMTSQSIESITVTTTQLSCVGADAAAGCERVSLQATLERHPARLVARAGARVLVAAGPASEPRRLLLHPLLLGTELVSTWEPWRRRDDGTYPKDPSLRVLVELDRITLDMRPEDVALAWRLTRLVQGVMKEGDEDWKPVSTPSVASTDLLSQEREQQRRPEPPSTPSNDELGAHYYKDDLRSGAFKIVSGSQPPMPYQVVLGATTVSWRYPNPRAVTRVVAYPLPQQEKELPCVLEQHCPMLNEWLPVSRFCLPIAEPREIDLFLPPPDARFAEMWRFRAVDSETEEEPPPFEFNPERFEPRGASALKLSESPRPRPVSTSTAEQLSSAVRVDSYFAPALLPTVRAAVRFTSLEAYAHNTLPKLTSESSAQEGYYVSKPLMKSHRVLSLSAADTCVHLQRNPAAGLLVAATADISSDILECATGTLEPLLLPTRVQVAASRGAGPARVRARAGVLRARVDVMRTRTVRSLVKDWTEMVKEMSSEPNQPRHPSDLPRRSSDTPPRRASYLAPPLAAALDGRVCLWIHNSCAVPLRVTQEDTEQIVPIGPGVSLAYRWRNPSAPKTLRFALVSPSTDWQWSNERIPFTPGTYTARLPGARAPLHVRVDSRGMLLAGSLVLANVLRHAMLFKIVSRTGGASGGWQALCSGELEPLSVGRSVLCDQAAEMAIKIKFLNQGAGWSGDIPLKECPKENVPWLVKVPSAGEVPFTCVWCRVSRTRDTRVVASLWPLYLLTSHLPLDTNVLIKSDTSCPGAQPASDAPPPMLQSVGGRGGTAHLQAPGTTSAKHSLTFQYKDIETPVTADPIPLHYGVTTVSVFDSRPAPVPAEQLLEQIERWLNTSRPEPPWPYSIVTRHWPGEWTSSLLQPRSDVNIRYNPVSAGGGCSLQLILSPVVMMCNASTLSYTLRAHDAAPLCALGAGSVACAPTAVLQRPFFLSVCVGGDTYVSSLIRVGAGGRRDPAVLAPNQPLATALYAAMTVSLLTLYYEVIHDINIIGISSTYVVINRLPCDVLVYPIAVPESEMKEEATFTYNLHKRIAPAEDDSLTGTPVSRFAVHGRWPGGAPPLRVYLGAALPAGEAPAHAPVPVKLGGRDSRRGVGLRDRDNKYMAVVITQQWHESRWLVTVSPDPCPQMSVRNDTALTLLVAQPAGDPPYATVDEVVPDCEGVSHYCVVEPGTTVYYSTPRFVSRYPPAEGVPRDPVEFITIGTYCQEEAEDGAEPPPPTIKWSPGAALSPGSQLLSVCPSATVKLQVTARPPRLRLLPVTQDDISASDIRKRLLGPFSSEEETQLKAFVTPKALDLTRLQSKSMLSVPEPGQEKLKEDDTGGPKRPSIKNPVNVDEKILKDLKFVIETDEKIRHHDEDMNDGTSVVSLKEKVSSDPNLFSNIESELGTPDWCSSERLVASLDGVVLEIGPAGAARWLLAAHLGATGVAVTTDNQGISTKLSISELQLDNLRYDTGQFDFPVVVSSHPAPLGVEPWPPLAGMLNERQPPADAHIEVKLRHDRWSDGGKQFTELTELDVKLGHLALYIEDAFVQAILELVRCATDRVAADAGRVDDGAAAEARALRAPLRLRTLCIHPLDLTLTLHTAVRMYIALDQSPLRLGAFKLSDMMTSPERLTHALTVHYLAAAVLAAGWVVGGLELLGAPGAVAARVGGATGGVRGVAAAAAAALLHSLSACAGSLARNLDLLAGDDEHSQRAAEARRRVPASFVAGLMTGITNFAINILGAVGGLAHHPIVGVGTSAHGTPAALRRGLLGALAKPLAATADLVALAGHGLLSQAGWTQLATQRPLPPLPPPRAGWARDCVRWRFRLAELQPLCGFDARVHTEPVLLLLTHKYLVIADPESERIVEMIEFRHVALGAYDGPVIELYVAQSRPNKVVVSDEHETENQEVSEAAAARVARYAGAVCPGTRRVLALHPASPAPPAGPAAPARRAAALHAALSALVRHNSDTHVPLL